MAPSATSEIMVQEVGVAKQVEKHVHGAEDKTPLEAISHGPIVQAGMAVPLVLAALLLVMLLERLRVKAVEYRVSTFVSFYRQVMHHKKNPFSCISSI